jgi:Protein of unknown function (DUF3309)
MPIGNNCPNYSRSASNCALPTWPYSAGWGAYPAGGLGLVLVVVLILVLLGKI